MNNRTKNEIGSQLVDLILDSAAESIDDKVAEHIENSQYVGDKISEAIDEAVREYNFENAIEEAFTDFNCENMFEKELTAFIRGYDFEEDVKSAAKDYDFEPHILKAIEEVGLHDTINNAVARAVVEYPLEKDVRHTAEMLFRENFFMERLADIVAEKLAAKQPPRTTFWQRLKYLFIGR